MPVAKDKLSIQRGKGWGWEEDEETPAGLTRATPLLLNYSSLVLGPLLRLSLKCSRRQVSNPVLQTMK